MLWLPLYNHVQAVALIREAFELTPKYSNTYQVTFEGLVSVDVAFIDGTDLSIETAKVIFHAKCIFIFII